MSKLFIGLKKARRVQEYFGSQAIYQQRGIDRNIQFNRG